MLACMHCRALKDMLVKTVNNGEGNSALVIGPPGSGKNLVSAKPLPLSLQSLDSRSVHALLLAAATLDAAPI